MFPKAAGRECCGTKAAPPPPAKPSPTRTAPRAHPCGNWGQGEGPRPCGDSATSPRALQAPSRASAPGAGRGESGSCCTLEAGRVLLRRGRGWGEPRVVLMPQPPRAAPCRGRLQSGHFSHPRPRNQVSAHRGPARWSSTWHAPRKSLLAPARSGAPRAHSLFLSSFKLFPLCSLPFVPPLII